MTSGYQQPKKKRVDEVGPLDPRSEALWRASRNPRCVSCELHVYANTVCMFGNGPVPAAGMVVGEAPTQVDDQFQRPLLGTPGAYLDSVFKDLDIDREALYVTQAVKCLPPREGRDKLLEKAVKECAPYLEAELAAVRPKAVLAMGATAYYFFAHKKGIIKQRGQAFFHEKFQTWVVPTVHPTYVMNNPTYDAPFISDVAMFRRFVSGQAADPPIEIILVGTLADWRAAEAELNEDSDKILSFDLETRGFKDFDQQAEGKQPGYSQVWCAALTRGRRGPKGHRVFMVPLEHPESPFLEKPLENWQDKDVWRAGAMNFRVADEYRPVVEGLVRLVKGSRVNGHNVKYDVRNLQQLVRRYGIEV